MFYKNILNSFIEIIEKNRQKNAFCINEKFYSYNDFAKKISTIRTALNLLSVKSKNIGIVANDDIETYASIFAIWLEGFAYVPLHPKQPMERNLEIIYQAEIDFVINSDPNIKIKNILCIDSSKLLFNKMNLEPKKVSDSDLAYILFTSGSTGKPKGVPITRGNVEAFFNAFCSIGFEIGNSDRCLQCFDLTFDVSVQSFLFPLSTGACVYTIPHNQIKYSYIFGLLDDHKLTFSVMAPSMLRYLRPYFDEIDVPSMKYCILTAEASPVSLVDEWSKCIPYSEIYDCYGPTEATIYCTYYKYNRIGANKQLNGLLSIGKPLKGLKAIIIDENGNILKDNQKGELCISGGQLAPKYWNNIQKTAESFFTIVWKGKKCRFYKTGDLCYFDDDGYIMCSGRIDYQVKIQGYRIELGEIEYHAREFLKGQNAITVTYENTAGNNEIALFIEGTLLDSDQLLIYLKSKIPYYMVPTKILSRKEFPLNSNGKVNRLLLKKILKELL